MTLAAKVQEGNVQAAARLISLIEDGSPEAADVMDSLYPHTGKAHVVGVTGAPGSGKSTLTDCLIAAFRRQQKTVGVIAIDPTSALTGGAVLGDRIRMQRHSADPGVFIRSLATRGWLGGLTGAAVGAVHVLDAMGKDIILVETVGAGQVELDIARTADTTLLVLNPGAGDEVQMMKAGILENADVFVVNKADREGAGQLKMSLESMLAMKTREPGEWSPPVILAEAVNYRGIDVLVQAVIEHREYLVVGDRLSARRRDRVRLQLLGSIESAFRDRLYRFDAARLEKLVEDIHRGHLGRQQIVKEIIQDMLDRLNNDKEQG